MNADDPRLTAYALDELDPAQREEVEQMLHDDPAAMAELEETRMWAEQLRGRLKAEREEGLHPAQRAELLADLAAVPRREVLTLSRRTAVWGALAAGVLIGASWALIFPALNSLQPRGVVSHLHSGSAALADGSGVLVGLAPETEEVDAEPLRFPDASEVAVSPFVLRLSPELTMRIAGGTIARNELRIWGAPLVAIHPLPTPLNALAADASAATSPAFAGAPRAIRARNRVSKTGERIAQQRAASALATPRPQPWAGDNDTSREIVPARSPEQ